MSNLHIPSPFVQTNLICGGFGPPSLAPLYKTDTHLLPRQKVLNEGECSRTPPPQEKNLGIFFEYFKKCHNGFFPQAKTYAQLTPCPSHKCRAGRERAMSEVDCPDHRGENQQPFSLWAADGEQTTTELITLRGLTKPPGGGLGPDSTTRASLLTETEHAVPQLIAAYLFLSLRGRPGQDPAGCQPVHKHRDERILLPDTLTVPEEHHVKTFAYLLGPEKLALKSASFPKWTPGAAIILLNESQGLKTCLGK